MSSNSILQQIPLSVLDLAIMAEGMSTKETLNRTLDTAQKAEAFGYKRFWVAEHHNMPHIASSATAVLIGYLAGGTQSIRVGSGGIMLPNHASLVIAEQFGTLASLYPNRIDLGLGRAPGTDGLTAQALRRDTAFGANDFPRQLEELKNFFSTGNSQAAVRAFPGEGVEVPMWILGSSTDSAYLAAALGLPYAFASHFAPEQLQTAARIYRERFVPSAVWQQPYFMPCVNAVVAESTAEAQRLATSFYRMFLGIIRNDRKPLQPPIDSMQGMWSEQEEAVVLNKTAYSFVGSQEEVRLELERFCQVLQVDELMITSPIYDQKDRLKSFKLLRELQGQAAL